MTLFGRHWREFSRVLLSGEFEATDAGLYLPKQGALLSGKISVRLDGDHVLTQPNRLTTAGVGILGAGIGSLVYASGFNNAFAGLYVVPYGNNINPDVAWEAAHGAIGSWSLYHLLGELGLPAGYGGDTEGYAETVLQPWNGVGISAGLVDNSASQATITMVTATTITIYGFALNRTSYADGKQQGRPYASGGDAGGGVFGFTKVDVTAQTNDTPDTITPTLDGATQYYWATPFTNPVDGNPCNGWTDLSSDDSFDVGLGHWVDPSNEAVNDAALPGGLSLAVSKLVTPLVCTNGQVVNISWGIQLT